MFVAASGFMWLPNDWLSSLVTFIGIIVAIFYTNYNTNKQIKESRNDTNKQIRDSHNKITFDRIFNICSKLDNLKVRIVGLETQTADFFNEINNIIGKSIHEKRTLPKNEISKKLKSYKVDIHDKFYNIISDLYSNEGYINLIFKLIDDDHTQKEDLKFIKKIFNYINSQQNLIIKIHVYLVTNKLITELINRNKPVPEDEFYLNKYLIDISDYINKIENKLLHKIK